MRIDDYNVSANGASSRSAAVETTAISLSGSKAQQTTGAGGAGDSVELSGLSRIFQASDSRRADRIQRLSALVRDGGYTVDAQTVSQALISETLAGGGSDLHA